MCIGTWICTHTKHTHAQVRICGRTCAHTHAWAHMCTHKTHTCAHAHTWKCMCQRAFLMVLNTCRDPASFPSGVPAPQKGCHCVTCWRVCAWAESFPLRKSPFPQPFLYRDYPRALSFPLLRLPLLLFLQTSFHPANANYSSSLRHHPHANLLSSS